MQKNEYNLFWNLVAGLLLVIATSACATHDQVFFTNQNNTGDIGILLDGRLSGTNVNDESYTTIATGHVSPGDITNGTNNEVIAFQQERPVNLIEGTSWSANNDIVTASFQNEMGTSFYVWLLKGPYVDREAQAVAACLKLSSIWKDERMGTQISTFQINDKTSDAAISPFLDFNCTDDEVNIRSQIGYNANGINIYYVDRVDFGSGYSSGNGVWCGDNTVVMGKNASDHLAAHEIGHAFKLRHVNALILNFDTTNVMHNASGNREYLTEGQNFRAHLNSLSVINTTYNLRPGLTTRNCAGLSILATSTCPAVQKRIWADGAYPAN